MNKYLFYNTETQLDSEKKIKISEDERLSEINLDIAPTTKHIYDHQCRCINCQSRELWLQKR